MADETHLVFLIHGIRDRAAWQSHVAGTLTKNGFKVCQCGYGYLDLFRFWWPGTTRLIPVAIVERQIRGYKSREEGKGNVVRMSAIAHSFGTYILSNILEEATDLHWERIIYCGAIVPETFRWDKVASQVDPENVINDVGSRDIWPGIAKLLSFGYGDTGSHGFAADVKNRFHECAHSEYFNGDFPSKFWAPWIHSGTWVGLDNPAKRSILPGWLGTKGLNFIGFPLVFILLLALVGLFLGSPLAFATRTWWAVYLWSAVIGFGTFLLLPKYRYSLPTLALIFGVTVGARLWLGKSPYHVDTRLLDGVAANATWEDDGRLALSVKDVPAHSTMLPNRLRVDVLSYQDGLEKQIKFDSQEPPPAWIKINQIIDGFREQTPVELRLRVTDPNDIVIYERLLEIKI